MRRLFDPCAHGRHRYQARYDKGPCRADFDGAVTEHRLCLAEKYRAVTYVRDICVRCGNTVERNAETSAQGAAERS